MWRSLGYLARSRSLSFPGKLARCLGDLTVLQKRAASTVTLSLLANADTFNRFLGQTVVAFHAISNSNRMVLDRVSHERYYLAASSTEIRRHHLPDRYSSVGSSYTGTEAL